MFYPESDPADAPGRSWPRAILFDLDGTLIDSVPDLAGALNVLAARHGLAPFRIDEVRPMIGHGVKSLVAKAQAARGEPLAGAALEARAAEMIAIYSGRLTEETTLLPGARESVAHFQRLGTPMALVTNKPEPAVTAIMAHFGLLAAFGSVVGDRGLPRKPAPDMLFQAMTELGTDRADALMVGDSAADVEAARAAGVAVIAVRGGYSEVAAEALGADGIADGLGDLPRAIAALRAHRGGGAITAARAAPA